ncbi:hypothetical protein INT47_005442 [Mucor saturninus]|uniref:Uncharacterized protein n=1 Tax=Mucor saturninus TaxID=64648 RepID=A0A8H7V6M3_9FUNG|nr:hypothetical protein INT47_005442 [Mucor saturninus]
MIFCIVILCLMATIQAMQINFNSHPSQSGGTYSMIKDTAQAHYESIIDDILSQHNEGILTELSFIIKEPQQMYAIMKPQADLLYGTATPIEDVCVAQMPGMIANQIHELSNQIYSSIDLIVTQHWKRSDEYYRQTILKAIEKGLYEQDILELLYEIMEGVNTDITDHIAHTIDEFHMLKKLKDGLDHCQAIFGQEAEKDTETFADKIWNALLLSLSRSDSNNEPRQNGFMGKYVFELRADIQSELYSRLYELARAVYEDLAFTS